jgi:hypothetical protein
MKGKKKSSGRNAAARIRELERQLQEVKLAAGKYLALAEARYRFMSRRSRAWKELAKLKSSQLDKLLCPDCGFTMIAEVGCPNACEVGAP